MEGETGNRLQEDDVSDGQIEQVTEQGDDLAVNDVERGIGEWRRAIELKERNTGENDNKIVAVFDRTDTANIEAEAGVKF